MSLESVAATVAGCGKQLAPSATTNDAAKPEVAAVPTTTVATDTDDTEIDCPPVPLSDEANSSVYVIRCEGDPANRAIEKFFQDHPEAPWPAVPTTYSYDQKNGFLVKLPSKKRPQ